MLLPIRWPSRSHGTWLSEAHGQQVGDLVRIGDVMNLRSQINDARLRHGLGVYQFTDPTLTPMVTPTRTVHLDELRTALGEVYAQAGLTPVYPSGPVTTGDATRLTQLMETAQAARATLTDRPSVVLPTPPLIYSWRWHEGAQTPDLATYGQVVDAIRLGTAEVLRDRRPYAPAELALADRMWQRTFGEAAVIMVAALALGAAAEVLEAGLITAGAGVAAIAEAIASGSILVEIVGTLSGGLVTLVGVGLAVFELAAIYFIIRYVNGLAQGGPAVRQVDVGFRPRVSGGSDEPDWNSLMVWP